MLIEALANRFGSVEAVPTDCWLDFLSDNSSAYIAAEIREWRVHWVSSGSTSQFAARRATEWRSRFGAKNIDSLEYFVGSLNWIQASCSQLSPDGSRWPLVVVWEMFLLQANNLAAFVSAKHLQLRAHRHDQRSCFCQFGKQEMQVLPQFTIRIS